MLGYKNWEDQHTALLGKVLLQGLLHRFGYPTDVLAGLQTGSLGKPFLDDRIDFTSLHSGGLVVGISDETRIGIDAEKSGPFYWKKFGRRCDPTNTNFCGESRRRIFLNGGPERKASLRASGLG